MNKPMNQRMNKLLTLGAVALTLGGCATKDFVNEQVTASSTATQQRMDGQRGELNGRIDKQAQEANGRFQGLDGRLSSQQAALDGTTKTAQEALERARAASKLAEGKFGLYAVSCGLRRHHLTAAAGLNG